ncbi:MAG: hypothetical protein CL930_10295 [Deltaproteobacteria bacterium]|nr:hypothetical protein [Deltaproteobacteria bacterium]
MTTWNIEERMRTPDFFIVGAPKCGTTAMYRWLSSHPEIFVPAKEIHFFGADLDHRRPEVSAERYQGLFEGVAPTHKAVGDVAVWYLMSETAADEISAYRPDARIIIMLRQPEQMLYSLHSQLLYSGEEDIEDFAEALAAEPDRAAGHRIPSSTHAGLEAPPTECLQYTRVVSFADQVQRYKERFEHVHVILHRDIKEDAAAVYRDVLDFIGVDTSYCPDFSVVNPNTRVKSQAARKLIQGARFGPIRSMVPPAMRSVGRKVFEGLQGLNTETTTRPPLDDEIAQRLRAEMAPDIRRLAVLVERDLSSWLD